jgi:predicted porin
MKKTLIAMAAVAVAGTAAAQVTITGAAAARFETATTAGGTESKGFYMSDAAIKFSASEDLGGGLTASASFGLDALTVNNATTAANTGSSLTVAAAGLGSVTVSNVESGDYLPIDLVTTSLFSNGQTADRLTIKSENIMGATITVHYSDGNSGADFGVGQTSMVYELDYATGPFAFNLGQYNVDKINNSNTDGGTRYKVSYDAGVAKVTYGRVETSDNNAVKRTETGASISAPLGALTVGANSVSSKNGTAASISGTSVTASYALSKRTALAFEQVNYGGGTNVNPERTRLTLTHTF